MTESFRRDGEYEQYANPYQGAQQHASSPVISIGHGRCRRLLSLRQIRR